MPQTDCYHQPVSFTLVELLAWAVGFQIESASNLMQATWVPVASMPSLVDDQWSLTMPLNNSVTVYRLKR